MASKPYDIENFNFDEHIKLLSTTADGIEYGKVTIITGPNGYGKSLLRKLLTTVKDGDKEFKVASVSMERRTTKNHDFAALASMAIDDPTDATSNATCYLIESVMNQDDRFFTIDEPEIGMGKEMLLGLIESIKIKIDELKAAGKFHGILFITHSEFFIEHMPHDKFINLEGMIYDEWKNREINPISPKQLSEWSLHLWRAIEKRISENKTK